MSIEKQSQSITWRHEANFDRAKWDTFASYKVSVRCRNLNFACLFAGISFRSYPRNERRMEVNEKRHKNNIKITDWKFIAFV